MKIFVSYTTRDNEISEDFFIRLNTFLRTFSIPFIDLLHNDSKDKQERIEKELVESDCLLLLNTNATFDSEWVIKELKIAEENQIPVYSFEYENLNQDQRFIAISKKLSKTI